MQLAMIYPNEKFCNPLHVTQNMDLTSHRTKGKPIPNRVPNVLTCNLPKPMFTVLFNIHPNIHYTSHTNTYHEVKAAPAIPDCNCTCTDKTLFKHFQLSNYRTSEIVVEKIRILPELNEPTRLGKLLRGLLYRI